MKAKDLIALMEYTQAFKKEPKARTMRRDRRDVPKPTMAMLLDAIAENEREGELLKKYLADKEKLNKKEEKKEDKDWWKSLNTLQRMTILMAMMPLMVFLNVGIPLMLFMKYLAH